MTRKTYRALVNTLDAKGKFISLGSRFMLEEEEAAALPAGTVELIEEMKSEDKKPEDKKNS